MPPHSRLEVGFGAWLRADAATIITAAKISQVFHNGCGRSPQQSPGDECCDRKGWTYDC